MTLTKPEKYVVIPAHAIEQAFTLDKPRRALLGTYVRLLSLAWERNYERTPRMREDDLYDFGETRGFLRLSRRQYFEQKADMELLGWLRSFHPIPGFVQFSFSKAAVEAMRDASAENRTGSAENRTPETRIEEDDFGINLIKSSSSINPLRNEVRKTALDDAAVRKTAQLFEHLPLLFDPIEHGVLAVRDVWLGLPYEYVLGWIAKAFHDRAKLTRSGPLGLIVARLNEGQAPDRFYQTKYAEILPKGYLEAIGEIEYECRFCDATFGTQDEIDAHERTEHAYVCEDCRTAQAFKTQAAWKEHYDAQHNPYTPKADEIPQTADGGSLADQLWSQVRESLANEMPKASWETWVRDAQAVRYDGNRLTVAARNAYAADWLKQRLNDRAARLLSDAAKAESQVEFVVL